MASQQVVIQAKGLNNFSNYYNQSPGSLVEALNVVIDRDQIIEPRRGFKIYGDPFGFSTDRTKQLINYKNRILRHVLTDLQFDNGSGQFTNFSGDSVVEVQNGLRIKSVEQNGNLYFTTIEGVKKISATSAANFSNATIQQAGGVRALDLQAQANYTTEGFLNGQSSVAYRLVWGTTDANDNLILGYPSNRVVVENLSTQSATVDLSFPIPDGITTNYFYQIYRTRIAPQTPSPVDPGDDMYLVLEDFPTSAEITAGFIANLNDITPEDIAVTGAPLYTNPNGGEGIAQANERPPFAQDITSYKNYVLYANTSTAQRLNLAFLSVQALVDNTSTITLTNGTSSEVYTFQGTNESASLVFGGIKNDYHNASPGPAEYITLDSSNDERSYLFWFMDNPANDLEPVVAGKINIKVDISATSSVSDIAQAFKTEVDNVGDFNVTGASTTLNISWANNGTVTSPYSDTIGPSLTYTQLTSGTGEDVLANKVFLPRVPATNENGPTTSQQLEQIATSLVRVINQQSNLISGFYTSGFDDIPGQILFESQDITGPAFWFYADSTSTGGEFNPSLPATNTPNVISTNEVFPNRVYYSKFQQPEAVPLLNYFDIGPRDKAILRIIALRESVFALKEDGIYRISGDAPPFFIAGFDFSAQIIAPDSAVVLNNQIYVLTTQGIVTITDSGVNIISRPIENRLKEITRPGYDFRTATFGVAYESDRSYCMWTVTTENDTVATQCFRYNTFTNSWTRWNNSKTCGIVNFGDDKMYLGAGDINYIEQERKNLDRTDFADRQYNLNILNNGVANNILSIGDLEESAPNDGIVQTQYLTITQYNRMLKKLDTDNYIKAAISPTLPDYYSSLEFTVGQNVRSKVVALAVKLDSDPAPSFNNYASSIGNYTQTITSTTHTTNTVTLNFSANNILNTRFINISGVDTVPTIDGTYQVINSTSNSVTISASIDTDGTMGIVQTDVDSFPDAQACFNIIMTKLNNDPGIFYTDYQLSTGTVDFESRIYSTNKTQNTITIVNNNLQLIAGPFILYKAFDCTVQYAPQFAGEPAMTKQFREGTIIFENSNYSNATLSYGSDLSPAFDAVQFMGQGNGDWGEFKFGEQNWGGVGAPIPFRTLIPRQKQRCRFMNVKFDHGVAREKFSIYGVSLTYRPISTRGYF